MTVHQKLLPRGRCRVKQNSLPVSIVVTAARAVHLSDKLCKGCSRVPFRFTELHGWAVEQEVCLTYKRVPHYRDKPDNAQ